MRKRDFHPRFGNRPARLRQRSHRDVRSVLFLFLEGNHSVYQSVQRVVLAHANVLARIVHGTSLANQNIARFGNLTAEKFHAETLAFGFPTVLGATYPFFVCHGNLVLNVKP